MTPATSSSNRNRVARCLLWGGLAIHVTIAVVAGAVGRVPTPGSDFDNFYEIGTKPGRPYVDFAVEYPVATAQAFRLLAPAAGTRERFGVTLVIASAVADIAVAAALYWGWGIEAAVCYLLIVAPLADLFFLRTDMWSTALATLGVAAWQRARPTAAALGFAAGAAFKLWPLTFLPLLLVPVGARRVMPIAAAAAAGLAILGWWLWIAGPLGLYQVLTFRGAQGWEIESIVGGVLMAGDLSSMRLDQGAWRIGTTSGPISIVLFAAGTGASLWMVWRGARTGHLGAGWAGGIGALLALSALLSPQFVLWLAPAAAIAWAEGDRRVAVLAALVVLLTNFEFKSFTPLLRGEWEAIALLLARNLILVGFVVDTVRFIARAPLMPSRAADRQLV